MTDNMLTVTAGAANKTMYLGGGTSFVGLVTSSQFIALGGLVLALLGFIVNWIYRAREDKRQQEMHRAQLEEIAERQAAAKLKEVHQAGS